MWYIVITWLIIVVCIFLVIVVLIQNSKGGGLAQNFSAGQQVMGVRKTTDYLEKATWVLATSVMVLSFVSVSLIPKVGADTGSAAANAVLENVRQNQQSAAPSFGTPVTTDAATEEQPATEAE